MQTDILLKQAQTALAELRTAMDKFEKFPNTHYASQLHTALNQANKLVAAYTVLKEQKEVSPELDLHLKVMSVQTPPVQMPVTETKSEAKHEAPVTEVNETLKKQEPPREEPKVGIIAEPKLVAEEKIAIEEKKEAAVGPVIQPVEEKTPEPVQINAAQTATTGTAPKKEITRLSIGINDKFRLINELFASNANEYNIALEQLNNVGSKEEADTYLKGLKNIYQWDEESEMVKKLYGMNQKRFI